MKTNTVNRKQSAAKSSTAHSVRPSQSPIWTVTKFETIRQLKKPAFWVAILLMPLVFGLVFLISFVVGADSATNDMAIDEDTTVAITDDAGILPASNPFSLYETKTEGIKAVQAGDVDLYFYLPANFVETKQAEFYHVQEGIRLFDMSSDTLKHILTEYVTEKLDPADVMVLTGDYEITETTFTKDGAESNALGKAIIPLMILIVFFIFVCIFGNRLLMTVVEEKENRISEMILTAVSARHLIIGKICAMMLLGVIQILVVVIPLIIMVAMNRDNPTVSMILSQIEIDPVTIITNLILFIFSILLFAGFCTFVGAIVPTARDASQFIGPVIVGVMCPFYFMQAFLVSAPSAMVYFLTYFPLSAPTAMMLRNAFSTLTPVEFYLGLAEIIVLAILIIHLTVKTFQNNAISFTIVKPWKRK